MDVNGDGIRDILSGCYSQHDQGQMVGTFWLFAGREDGTFARATEVRGTDQRLLQAHPGHDGDNARLFENICTRPFAVDWDGDGDVDIVSGNARGTFFWFEGVGGGGFKPRPRTLTDVDGRRLYVPGGDSDPTVIDWDGDGDLDLVSSCMSGDVFWSENTANHAEPACPTMPRLTAFRRLINSSGGTLPADAREAFGAAARALSNGDYAEAETGFRKLAESSPEVPALHLRLAICVAYRAATLADDARRAAIDETLKLLETAIDKGWRSMVQLRLTPAFRILHDHDGFARLVEKMSNRPMDHTRVHVADVNGDGKLDLMVGDMAGRVWLYRQK